MFKKLTEWLDANLVPDWRQSWKLMSVKGAGAFGAVISLLAANTDVLMAIVSFMPNDPMQRFLAAVGVGVVAAVGPWFLRTWNEGSPDDAAG